MHPGQSHEMRVQNYNLFMYLPNIQAIFFRTKVHAAAYEQQKCRIYDASRTQNIRSPNPLSTTGREPTCFANTYIQHGYTVDYVFKARQPFHRQLAVEAGRKEHPHNRPALTLIKNPYFNEC